MHGAGNDFVLIDNRDGIYNNYNALAKEVCHRRFGIGADGLMAVELSNTSDIKMVYINSDGSDATMCGNGIRCFSKFVHDNQIVKKDVFEVETADGPKEINIEKISENKSIVTVDMGPWKYESGLVPVDTAKQEYVEEKMVVNNQSFDISCLHMGVPHSVIFIDEISEELTAEIGPLIEKDSLFPNNINVNFAQVIDANTIKVDTWERGAGKTLACGTGVCSVAIVANRIKNTNKKVDVHVAGGMLTIEVNDQNVMMTGEAVTICKGEYVFWEEKDE